ELGEVGLRPLDHFLQRATLIADVDALDADADAVTLMTLHNAKGLEFPVVFISGLEDGLFPLARAYDDPPQLEEERRLFYVGITRAERKLYLTHAEERRRNGELMPARPSSFLDGIPDQMLDRQNSVRVRSSGRGAMHGGWGRGRERMFGTSSIGGTSRWRFRWTMSDMSRPSRAWDFPTSARRRSWPSSTPSSGTWKCCPGSTQAGPRR